jgi:GST-like protein
MITLYGLSSPNVTKVAIMLEEAGLTYDMRHVNVFGGQQFEPDFLAMNPFGRVPVLVDEKGPAKGAALFESGAILIYLAESYAPALIGTGPARNAVICWLMGQMANVGPMFGQHNHFLTLASEKDSYASQRYRDQALRLYGVLNQRLSQSAYLAGEAYSIADVATFPWALYVRKHGFTWEEFPHLRRWRDAIVERPAVQRSKKAMETNFGPKDAEAVRSSTPAGIDKFYWRQGTGPQPDFGMMRE